MPINRVTIVGNLTRDPELRGLPSGGSVCSLRVAVNARRREQSGEWVDEPNFFNVSVFGASADNAARYLAKGRQVAVDGRLRWREWQDQQGNRRESVEIVAQEVQFIGGRDGAPAGGGGAGGGFSGGGGDGGGGGDWGGGGGGGGGGFNGPGAGYPVDQGDFGGNGGGGGAPAPAQAPRQAPPQPAPADDDIPF